MLFLQIWHWLCSAFKYTHLTLHINLAYPWGMSVPPPPPPELPPPYRCSFRRQPARHDNSQVSEDLEWLLSQLYSEHVSVFVFHTDWQRISNGEFNYTFYPLPPPPPLKRTLFTTLLLQLPSLDSLDAVLHCVTFLIIYVCMVRVLLVCWDHGSITHRVICLSVNSCHPYSLRGLINQRRSQAHCVSVCLPVCLSGWSVWVTGCYMILGYSYPWTCTCVCVYASYPTVYRIYLSYDPSLTAVSDGNSLSSQTF